MNELNSEKELKIPHENVNEVGTTHFDGDRKFSNDIAVHVVAGRERAVSIAVHQHKQYGHAASYINEDKYGPSCRRK